MTASNDSSTGPTEPSAAQKRSGGGDDPALGGVNSDAYRAWVERTAAEPLNEAAWIGRAELAPRLEEKITSLNRALELNPANGAARHALRACLQELLGRDASLQYLGETSTTYRVRTAGGFEFIHPKDRAPSEPKAPAKTTRAQAVYRWLNWSVLGLIPVGLGTLLSAPVTAFQAIAALQGPLDQSDRRRMWLAILLSALLWPAAIALMIILVIHLT